MLSRFSSTRSPASSVGTGVGAEDGVDVEDGVGVADAGGAVGVGVGVGVGVDVDVEVVEGGVVDGGVAVGLGAAVIAGVGVGAADAAEMASNGDATNEAPKSPARPNFDFFRSDFKGSPGIGQSVVPLTVSLLTTGCPQN